MKKGIFGSWFKELASLIFTQTVQAFLLAIVMSIIVNALAGSSDESNSVGTYGGGLLAIIALSQFGKIELLIKQIFGVTSQFNINAGSMNDGRGGLLAGLVALKGMKNVADNVPKAIGGVSNRIKSNREIKSLSAQRDKLNAEIGADDALQGMEEQAGQFVDQVGTGAARQMGANAVNGGSGGLGVDSSQISQLISAVKEQTAAIKSQKMDSGKSSKQEQLRELNQKIKDAELKKRDSGRQILSGITETVGAVGGGVVGATAGAIYSLGTGDDFARNISAGAGVGVGIGDKVGKAGPSIVGGIDHLRHDKDKFNTEIRNIQMDTKKIKSDESVYKAVTDTLKNANKSGFMKNRTSQERANTVKKLQENAKKKIDASNM